MCLLSDHLVSYLRPIYEVWSKSLGTSCYGNGVKEFRVKPLDTDWSLTLFRMRTNLYCSRSLILFITVRDRKMCRVWSSKHTTEALSVTMFCATVCDQANIPQVRQSPYSPDWDYFLYKKLNPIWKENNSKTSRKSERMPWGICSPYKKRRRSRNVSMEKHDG